MNLAGKLRANLAPSPELLMAEVISKAHKEVVTRAEAHSRYVTDLDTVLHGGVVFGGEGTMVARKDFCDRLVFALEADGFKASVVHLAGQEPLGCYLVSISWEGES